MSGTAILVVFVPNGDDVGVAYPRPHPLEVRDALQTGRSPARPVMVSDLERPYLLLGFGIGRPPKRSTRSSPWLPPLRSRMSMETDQRRGTLTPFRGSNPMTD